MAVEKRMMLKLVFRPLAMAGVLVFGAFSLGESQYLRQSQHCPTDRLAAFEFRGHHIGDPIQDIFPLWSTDDAARNRCSGEQPEKTIICSDNPDDRSDASTYLGNVRAKLLYEFVNHKLNRLTVTLAAKSVREVR
jgi:hypothetical protein